MWFIGGEVAQETSAPPPKKNPECCQIQCAVIHRARTNLVKEGFVLWPRDFAGRERTISIGHWT